MSARALLPSEMVGRALASAAASLAPSGASSWRAVLRNGKEVGALVELKDGWLRYTAELSRPVPRGDHWRLLELNDALPATARVSLAPKRRQPWLRVDVPLAEREEAVADQVSRACAALLASVERLAHPGSEANEPASVVGLCEASEPAMVGRIDDSLAIEPMTDLLHESGWDHRARDDGSIDVDLGARREKSRALVRLSVGEMRAEVVVTQAVGLAPASQAAIGTLLLLGTDVLGGVRGTVRRGGAEWSVALEARATGPPRREALDLALVSLGSAIDTLGHEVRALLHEPTAVAYLRIVSGER